MGMPGSCQPALPSSIGLCGIVTPDCAPTSQTSVGDLLITPTPPVCLCQTCITPGRTCEDLTDRWTGLVVVYYCFNSPSSLLLRLCFHFSFVVGWVGGLLLFIIELFQFIKHYYSQFFTPLFPNYYYY